MLKTCKNCKTEFETKRMAQCTWTDPPYNVNYTGGANGDKGFGTREGIQNDKMSKENFKEFLYNAMLPIINNTSGGIYVCMSSSELD